MHRYMKVGITSGTECPKVLEEEKFLALKNKGGIINEIQYWNITWRWCRA
ncbi:MAG: hypothetical protein K0R31_2156 [Clostridiales bacterium]|jgi:hypothetical protein|nr:hypothetical protein [Clostridiales bacterium]